MKRTIISIALLLLTACACLRAQIANEAAVLGTVKDQSGAVIPGAAVTVRNLDTGYTKSATSDAAGNFEILALPIGPYTVNVTVQGFKTWTLNRIVLQIGERSRIAPALTIGAHTEQVTVTSEGEQLQTEQASVETVVQQKQIADLPLDGRNTVQLVSLAPGMQYTGQAGGQFGAERGSTVQGVGVQSGQTQFTLDGFNANGSMDEGATAIPSVDTIAEFNVKESNFSAEYGRDPMQIVMVTKSGTNEYHGSLWEFARNNDFAARNYFSTSTPKLIQNQFGAAGGGRIIRDKTFFFASYEGMRIRQDAIFNSTVPSSEMLNGDFSSVSTPIIDPDTGQQFPGNQIDPSRFNSASTYLMPYLLQPNSSDGRFHYNAPTKTDSGSATVRLDDNITDKQRIYGRWVRFDSPQLFYGYSPSVYETNKTVQNSFGINYFYTITPHTLFSISVGYQKSNNTFVSPGVGTENLTDEAGIQGFPTLGRESAIGLPTVNISGYTGFGELWGVNGRLWSHSWNGKTSLNLVRGKHLIDVGWEYDNRAVYGSHASFAARGSFTFNGQYTGNGLADYLLGLTSSGGRNYPLAPFGVQSAPYSAWFVQDTYKVTPSLTLDLGLRYDRWFAKRSVAGNAATFDPTLGKVIAGVDENGQVDLSAQPEAQYLAVATAGLWVPSNTVGIPAGLFQPNGFLSPRIGVTWRPGGRSDFVVRGSYGIFTSSFQGNIAASSIVGPPYWGYETPSWSASSKQNWQTAFSADPTSFSTPGVAAPAWNVKAQKTHEWNVSIQHAFPLQSTLTLSYVGNHVSDGISGQSYDDVPAGEYSDLQAARPYPDLSSVVLYQNMGSSWYNGLHAKWERRFTQGFTFTAAYAYSKLMLDNLASCIYCNVQPYTPEGYNRGRSPNDFTHILTVNSVYELPIGRGRTFLSDINRFADLAIGGWELSGIYSYTSGSPLTFDVPGATLGNGYDTRPNLVGSLSVSDPGPNGWFNPDALSAPDLYTYGDSGMGVINGPATKGLDMGLLKNFFITENKYFQFRWEIFNAPNFVNFGNPNTSIGQSTTGQIFSAGAPREIQLGLKFIF
ncbi:MAG TPA: TonB-dependent receptor [Terracidiphilus sp.]|nr:TonB-dependent receptor [Terracidiphilus sp.]